MSRIDGRGEMGYEMAARDALNLLDALRDAGVQACVGGGWGVDALLGEQTRTHSDLDLWLPASQLEQLFVAFVAKGVDRVMPWPGDRPWNFALHDGHYRRVDLHLYEVLSDGSLHYGSVTAGDAFPARAVTGSGMIDGHIVGCERPEWSLLWHTGYPPRPSDHHDMSRLCDRFHLQLPPEFR